MCNLQPIVHDSLTKDICFSTSTLSILTFYVIPPHWHDTGSRNPSACKTRTYIFYIVNSMGADVLTNEGARASTTVIFNLLNRINSVPATSMFKTELKTNSFQLSLELRFGEILQRLLVMQMVLCPPGGRGRDGCVSLRLTTLLLKGSQVSALSGSIEYFRSV